MVKINPKSPHFFQAKGLCVTKTDRFSFGTVNKSLGQFKDIRKLDQRI